MEDVGLASSQCSVTQLQETKAKAETKLPLGAEIRGLLVTSGDNIGFTSIAAVMAARKKKTYVQTIHRYSIVVRERQLIEDGVYDALRVRRPIGNATLGIRGGDIPLLRARIFERLALCIGLSPILPVSTTEDAARYTSGEAQDEAYMGARIKVSISPPSDSQLMALKVDLPDLDPLDVGQ